MYIASCAKIGAAVGESKNYKKIIMCVLWSRIEDSVVGLYM